MLEFTLAPPNTQPSKCDCALEITPTRKLHLQLSQFNQQRLEPNFIRHNWA